MLSKEDPGVSRMKTNENKINMEYQEVPLRWKNL